MEKHSPREGHFSGQLPFDARVFFHAHFFNVLASQGVIAGELTIYTPPSHIYLTQGRPERHQVNPHRYIPRCLPPARLVGGNGANHYTNLDSPMQLIGNPVTILTMITPLAFPPAMIYTTRWLNQFSLTLRRRREIINFCT